MPSPPLLLLLLVLLPFSAALECHLESTDGSGKPLPEYYSNTNQTACAPGAEYCITTTEEDPQFGRVTRRFCEVAGSTPDRCAEEGCQDLTVAGVAQVHRCCCKGDFCNRPNNATTDTTDEATTDTAVTPDPAATADPTVTPNPTVLPDPTVTLDPAATTDPVANTTDAASSLDPTPVTESTSPSTADPVTPTPEVAPSTDPTARPASTATTSGGSVVPEASTRAATAVTTAATPDSEAAASTAGLSTSTIIIIVAVVSVLVISAIIGILWFRSSKRKTGGRKPSHKSQKSAADTSQNLSFSECEPLAEHV